MRFIKPKGLVFLVFALLIFLLLSASSAKADEAKRKKLFFSVYGSRYFATEGPVVGIGGSIGYAFHEKVALEVEFNAVGVSGLELFLPAGRIVFNLLNNDNSLIPYFVAGVSFFPGGAGAFDLGGGVKIKLGEPVWLRLDSVFSFYVFSYCMMTRLSAGVMWAF